MIEPDTIGFLLTDVARMQRAEFEKRISNAGLELTPGEARALLNIDARAGGRQNEIAEKMGVEPMTMSGYIDKLEGLGLVERLPDPTDRRARNVVLTERAQPLLAAILDQASSMIDNVLAGLSENQRDALHRALRQMRANLNTMQASRENA